MRRLALWAACAVVAVSAMAQPAPPPNPDTWTLIGPTRTVWRPTFGLPETSGRISSIAINSLGTLFVGAAGGGVWKREGSSWVALTDAQPSLQTGALAIDPNHPDTLYLGTGTVSALPGYYGMGLLKSLDSGATWTHIIGPFLSVVENSAQGVGGEVGGGLRIPALAVSPSDSNVLLSGVSVHLHDFADSGIYRSADGGFNWTPVQTGNIGSSVVFDPTDGNIAYAALGSTISSFAGTDGIYKSTNGGQDWVHLRGVAPNLLPVDNAGQISLAISPSNPLTLYAGISDNAVLGHLRGLYKTTDGGVNWTRLAAAPDYCAPFCSEFNAVAVHPSNPDIVFVGGSEHVVYRSLDGGATWGTEISGIPPNTLHYDVSAFGFSPDGNTVYVANDGGIASSTTFRDASPAWNFINDNLSVTQFYGGFDVDPSRPDYAFAGSQDNGFQFFNGDLQWQATAGGEGGNILYDAASDTAFIAEDVMPMTSFGYRDNLIRSAGIPTSEQFAVPAAFALNRSNPAIQYTASNRVYQTTNTQILWTPISPVLAGPFGFISTVAVADHNPEIVCAGTSDGHVWCTANSSAGAAATWSDYSAGLPGRYVTKIHIHHFKEYIIAVTFSGFSGIGGDTLGHVFLSTQGGLNWSDISGNLPNTPVNDVLIDTVEPGEPLYAATDAGVFRTLDRGIKWARVARGLPNAVVTGLHLHAASHTLYAGTMGRSMWRVSLPLLASTSAPAVTMAPWQMRFSAHFGGPNPPPQNLGVMNANSGVFASAPMAWTATPSTSHGGPWISASPAAGIDDTSLSVAVDVTGLPLGLYNGIVRLAAPSSTNAPQDLVVMLAVTDTAPRAMAGADIAVDATSPAGAAVGLDATASSDPDGDMLTFDWTGPFGKASGPKPTVQVPIGTYPVTLTVADPAGLKSSATIKVTVKGTATQVAELISAVLAINGQNLPPGMVNALTAVLQNALNAVGKPALCPLLHAFERQVQAFSGHWLTAAQAAQLAAGALRIEVVASCR